MENDNKHFKSLKDVTENLQVIIDRALAGIHVQDKFLKSVAEFSVALLYRSGIKKILKGFKKTLEKAQGDYIISVVNGSNLFSSMIIWAEFRQCYEFYKEELRLVTELLKDYHYYMFDGRVIKSLLGYVRPEEDLVPYDKHGRVERWVIV